MTKDKIKKALEVCIDIYATCNDCLYNGVENCDDRMRTDVLKLIIEQDAEIERLRTTLGQCNTELNSALESLKRQCREIGELKAKNEVLKVGVATAFTNGFSIAREYVEKDIRRAQIDILNYLKEKCKFDGHTVAVYKNDIDELIKEIEEQ